MNHSGELTSTKPLYIKVAEELKKLIDDGSYSAGSKLPSESQLVNKFNVSRVTVRKALQQLFDIGYIYSEKGKGSYVAYRKLKHDFVSTTGFTEELHDSGMVAENKVIFFEKVAASEEIADKLAVNTGEPLHHCCRIRLVNGEIVAYEDFYIPISRLPELSEQDMQGSKFAYLNKQKIEMVKTVQKITPVLPDVQQQQLLLIEADQPILENESQNYCSENEIYEFSRVYYKPSRYDFEIIARKK